MRLWEAKHPYYMHEGSYYEAGCHQEFDSFDDFLAKWGDADKDMNRVHRWDWDKDLGCLSIYFILQRKAKTMSCDVAVSEFDEDRVKQYLMPFAELEAKIWSPLLSI